jgi:hypothetical protein
MRIFAKMVPVVEFGTNKNEIAGGWRKLHSKVLYNLHS